MTAPTSRVAMLWWAIRAHLLQSLGREADAAAARERAEALTDDVAVREYFGRAG